MRAVICRAWGAELFSWYRAGALKPCVTQCLPLERSVEAIRLLIDRKVYGKVVVMPGQRAG